MAKKPPRNSVRTRKSRNVSPRARPEQRTVIDKIIDALVMVKAFPFWISLIYFGESIKEAARSLQGPITLLAGGVVMYILQRLNGNP
ncbi:hypothetical protein HNP48_004694 [Acidovorax soli]|uniref:Uncharacterized protein n=1 Tax=Acidovorax soli TaxID=592050 RepID=A0A7X0UB52_9BURK|nr:hypothetical protein [Acidovorax soli]MBB6561992.1 hypothetical protein [Acidovorax soli]